MQRERSMGSTWGRCWRLAAALVLSAASANAMAYSVSLTPATQTVDLGTEVAVDLVLTDLGPEGLGAFNFDVSFDGARLDFLSYIDGGVLGLSLGLAVDQVGNLLTVYDFSLDDPLALLAAQQASGGSLTLATLRFGTLAVGTADLDFGIGALGDIYGSPVEYTQAGASVVINDRVVAPVSEPATAALVLAGLLAGARRRRIRA